MSNNILRNFANTEKNVLVVLFPWVTNIYTFTKITSSRWISVTKSEIGGYIASRLAAVRAGNVECSQSVLAVTMDL
jgi:hypothetical protein